jgi:hypothetical protein
MKAVDYHGLWDNIIDLKNLLGDIDAALDLINGETP